MAQKNKNIYTIRENQTTGRVQIADDVFSTIAALAATEAEGVACISGGVTHEKAARAGARALAKGVRTEVSGHTISVRLIIVMKYNYSIPATTAKIQERVKAALENMTGFEVSEVNVSVADVQVEQAEK